MTAPERVRNVPRRRGDGFYRLIVFFGRIIYGLASQSVELNREGSAQPGGVLIASNHTGPYDVSCLMKASRRPLDFVSLTNFDDKPLVGWLFRRLNAVFLAREGDFGDSATFREVVKRLRRGHAVAIFPEGEMRKPGTEASRTGEFQSGFGRLAVLGRSPILPAAVLDGNNFTAPTGWLPWPRTTWGVIFGEPIPVPEGVTPTRAAELMEQQWLEQVTRLEQELRTALDERFGPESRAPEYS